MPKLTTRSTTVVDSSSNSSCSNNSISIFYYVDEMDTETCRHYAYQRWRFDFYATAIGASLVVFLGVLGNAGTLFTLSGRRLTTATFVYYRAIACVDLCRCIFVFTYVLRVLVPFRRYYWTTFYEAHFMYFIIGSLGFISTTLAVLLCFRLCYCIVQSRRMKKMRTSPVHTKRIIYAVAAASFLINVWLCFEREVRTAPEDECSFGTGGDNSTSTSNNASDGSEHSVAGRNRSDGGGSGTSNIGGKKYALAPSEFSYAHSSLLKAVHNIPVVILLVLLSSTLALLLLCIAAFSGVQQRDPILSNRDSSTGNSRTWRTQRQLCRLFMVLSLSYAFGLLPSLIYEFLLNNDHLFGYTMSSPAVGGNGTGGGLFTNSTTNPHNDSSYMQRVDYENLLAAITRRQISATILNVIQNFSHAISFYIYVSCSEEFRNEFFCKLRRIGRTAYSSIRLSHFSPNLNTMSPRSSPVSPLLTRARTTPAADRRRVPEDLDGDEPKNGDRYLTAAASELQAAESRTSRSTNRNCRLEPFDRHQTRALLSENEGDEWETREALTREPSIRRTQSDARFLDMRRLGGIARELSCQFYARVTQIKEEEPAIMVREESPEANEDGFCLVFEPEETRDDECSKLRATGPT